MWRFDTVEQHGRGEDAPRNIEYLDASMDTLWQKNFIRKIVPIGHSWYDYLPYFYWNGTIKWNLKSAERFRFIFIFLQKNYHDLQTHSPSGPNGQNLNNINRIPEPPCQEPTFSPWPHELLLHGWWERSSPQVSVVSQLQIAFGSREGLRRQLSCMSTNTLKLFG